MYLDNVVPVQHEVGIGLMSPQISRVRHQEAEVGLQELVAVVGLRAGPRPPPAARPAPGTRCSPSPAPLLQHTPSSNGVVGPAHSPHCM